MHMFEKNKGGDGSSSRARAFKMRAEKTGAKRSSWSGINRQSPN